MLFLQDINTQKKQVIGKTLILIQEQHVLPVKEKLLKKEVWQSITQKQISLNLSRFDL